ncbi:hypothetical protein CRG98_040919 [Punica granatum]|uniref:Reverse transcriptase Ty1/copia-type domain-containing protein n=1 Tax=Punica granatum TaxID=22663 RepID=A0A2I0I3Y9_PUNGR|nr:hypothetical protein CRG98_040919 [Punica granatum]
MLDGERLWRMRYKRWQNIEQYKVRLKAKRFTQVEGTDFHETFVPVAKLVTVLCLLTVSLARQWELHQLDVHNAFLHGDLEEEVYMKLSPIFKSSQLNQVCNLHKLIYGLRQASRNWITNDAAFYHMLFCDASRLSGVLEDEEIDYR